MLDIVPWFGLAVVFAGFVTLSWVLAQSQAPGVPTSVEKVSYGFTSRKYNNSNQPHTGVEKICLVH